ncbi:hypothetical protein GCM10022393_23560 [Aquimarina addita]|uniref:Uncharacterized protein n=1 Tax=Aquimarina addita TaxID=870485 RepID=A0ABP6UNS8_9FLAO
MKLTEVQISYIAIIAGLILSGICLSIPKMTLSAIAIRGLLSAIAGISFIMILIGLNAWLVRHNTLDGLRILFFSAIIMLTLIFWMYDPQNIWTFLGASIGFSSFFCGWFLYILQNVSFMF